MFTGIVTAVGVVREVRSADGGLELTITCPYSELVAGESIAVDGACLTATRVSADEFTAHLVRTTLERTGFATYSVGRRVNLERALRVGDPLGGHLVQGHVDGVGTVIRVAQHADARLIDLEVPDTVARVSIPLGSITVDGVSLTVNAIPAPGTIQISLIPFTLEHTTLGERRVGDRVHLEGDTIGKYVAEMLKGGWRAAQG
ncbi:MAG: riboflavin synthase [Gemmatimonadales bacterium]|jgi:riboflavin synthase|nr:riboflavin synthase [Gemmatimonadota bacterium]